MLIAGPSKAATETKPAAAPAALAIVLATSTHLAEKTGQVTPFALLRASLNKAIRLVPKTALVGLRISGHRISAEQAGESCQDSELLIPIAPNISSKLMAKLSSIKPQGKRSYLYSAAQAIKDLEGQTGSKSILLFVDGADECSTEPIEKHFNAATLKQQGYSFHIRGLNLDAPLATSLKVFAEKTGGSFADAQDLFTLTQQMTVAVQSGVAATPTAQDTVTPAAIAPTADVPVTAPPNGVVPEPKEPPRVGPVPLPFDEEKFINKIVTRLDTMIAQKIAAIAPPPPPAPVEPQATPPLFSKIALIVIGAESLVLLLAIATVILLIRQRR